MMSLAGIMTGLSRLTFSTVRQSTRNISTNTTPLCFRVTDALLGEPLKKKKRLDPAIIRHREDRKRRKLEKAIRRLQKHARQLKPLSEIEIPYKLIDEKAKRTREKPKLSSEVLEKRVLLEKAWTRYKLLRNASNMQTIENILLSQQKALDALREESEELYQAAIQIDISNLLPHCSNGPAIVRTPPIPNYAIPDGDYVDITVKYEGEQDIETLTSV